MSERPDAPNRTDATHTPYPTTPREPLRTIDHRDESRTPTPEALEQLRALVNETDSEGNALRTTMPSPNSGDRMSQRQVARKLLAGRSYQAVQSWLAGDPIPKVTAEWFTDDLQRVDARAEDRMVRVAEDEIAIIVRR